MKTIKIAVIPGDGIGKEVIPEGIKALQAAISARSDIKLKFEYFDWSCETYMSTGHMMPDNGLDILAQFDAIYLGAVGFPNVPDHISLWGLLLPIRRQFNQYVNLRPVRLFKGVESPLANKKVGDIDFWVVRENVEGEYSDIGGHFNPGTPEEVVVQQSLFSKKGCDRIIQYAFDLCQKKGLDRVTSATKSNGMFHSMPFWDKCFWNKATQYEDIDCDQFHIDILCANLVKKPEHFKVIVASNLFGDILSDLGPACTGTIAIAPSANINPEGTFPSMFEPVHGSAPDIYGRNIANPIGTIWAGSMMLDHLGLTEEAKMIMNAIEHVLENKTHLTPDMGGTASTQELGSAVSEFISKHTNH
ncbi:tartrate dehydrogenase [Vibrio porteresiae]|uniref:D-malate dehydrogenase (decarboxylating) n=1 Tax=Vibrio porteresiae DSM 19223 TaxID=1123496 RepID=A0ABZ0QKB1_9VIBR|nr:tartrate dehydrogenase [Vibrio porteresiae]WPC76476.1 tartrate dehydrogenase [Vibrio porteresiae DSM 19223]